MKVLIAEDERTIADVVAFGVRMTWPGCSVVIACNGEEAIRLFNEEHPNLAILDITMPPPDGFDVCREIRKESQIPVLMLTGRHTTVDKVRALDLGADDYLTKPFDHLELMARLRALARRSAASVDGQPHASNGSSAASASLSSPDIVVGDIALNTRTRQVVLKGTPIQLTSTEYRLLEELVRNAGSVLPHNLLIERVWGPEYAGEEHYLKVFVRRLRRKLGDTAQAPQYIQNEWGIGYRFIS
jgi:DNA-binding response OmpR family regulator